MSLLLLKESWEMLSSEPLASLIRIFKTSLITVSECQILSHN